MGNWGLSLFLVACFVLILWYHSQTRMKNKMLCFFIRPNRQMIEKWVPLQSTYVVFDRKKYGGIGRYICDPSCVTMMWYARGINRLFGTLVPTLTFKWDTPNPLDPKTFERTWYSPESMQAGWEEHQHIAFARASAQVAGVKKTLLDRLFPLIVVGLILIVLFLVWKNFGALDQRMWNVEQAINNLPK